MFTDLFGKHPFGENEKRPVVIKKGMAVPYIAPAGNIYQSDINQLFFSTNHLTVGMFQLSPGSSYKSADIHEGDESYYVLNGELTVQNPETGECVQLKKGDSLLVPMFGYHKGYNFEQDCMRVLFAIAPNALPGNRQITDYLKESMRMLKSGKTMPALNHLPEWN